ncbi:MAG TPA: Gfo/Idh/MocA family oxidoreductase [Clostridia bacterium]|jgi:predicted dehydrogenase|nr:Gfo/Idh/MocA family oxidoreductase [Clostridia bacterium]HPY43082.1 Gfo/Idh/MocA family oxidoreductase [Clostridia bacterium]HQA96334.1 Gfo/Idh/MocA family oxidoreductase [Clostridia bacterium]HQO56222.1 Gfo/Idh/MocA family oxidoreductase [Clostridia bacterium]HUM60667.1 Gfo/Idh/MocA family oxidoreductase [Clostridia bacterium]
MATTKIAFIGVGSISGIYLDNITRVFKGLKIAGVCDLIPERAINAREKYNLPRVYEDMYEAFRDPEVDIILNLTRPYQHYEVTRLALEHGKHVYTEKPLGITLEEGDALVKLAKEKNLQIGGAPDTFLGAGLQSCRKYIDAGMIGDVVGAAAFMICRGHETWHPDPDFYYQKGGGPMLDMGPYYMTALTSLLGRVDRLVAAGKRTFDKRMITSQPHAGTVMDVNVDTYATGILQFASGAIGTLFTTFDVYYDTQARFEIYGTEGTLILPDPNFFGGPIRIFRPETGKYDELPLLFDYAENSRALGLADMARALETGREARANIQQIHHVIDILTAFERSARSGGWVDMKTPYERPAPMVKARLRGILD